MATRFIAHSRVMRALVEQVQRFARTDSNVLIAGEAGTGRSALARELHARGSRARAPFVTIDCTALTKSGHSDLFGSGRVAAGSRISAAAAGSIYLDAVTELPFAAQGTLLRVLEEKRGDQRGAQTSFAPGARIMASAAADVEDVVRRGAFRSDLYHRLRVLALSVPPLRERPEDVIPLANHFMKTAPAAARRDPPPLSSEVSSALRDYGWPGNVRELRQAIERAMELARGGPIRLDHLPREVLEAAALGAETTRARRPTLEEVERRYIVATLQYARGNQTDAAKILGISRKALWERRKRYGLE